MILCDDEKEKEEKKAWNKTGNIKDRQTDGDRERKRRRSNEDNNDDDEEEETNKQSINHSILFFL